MAANSPHHSEQSNLVRGLGSWSAIAIVIGDTIGTGVFLVASDMARAVGSASAGFGAWILGGFIVLLGAFCYAELGAAFPEAGGPYVYLSRGLGPLWGFLFGWMSSFLERPVGDGHTGGRICSISGILVSSDDHAFVQRPRRTIRLHLHDGPAAGRVGGDARDGYQLFQCADGRRDPGSADVPEGGHDLGYCCRRMLFGTKHTGAAAPLSSGRSGWEPLALC